MTQQKRPWLQRCETDAKLLERTGLDEFTLRTLRREFYQTWAGTSASYRQVINGEGAHARFAFMDTILRVRLVPAAYDRWLQCIEHSRQDVDEMCTGQYPVSPYMVRLWSALFGVAFDWLLLSTGPVPPVKPISIDPWPMTQTR